MPVNRDSRMKTQVNRKRKGTKKILLVIFESPRGNNLKSCPSAMLERLGLTFEDREGGGMDTLERIGNGDFY